MAIFIGRYLESDYKLFKSAGLLDPNDDKLTIYKNSHKQVCPQCKAKLTCIEDYFGSGSHYWTLKCDKCGKEFYFDNYSYKLNEVKEEQEQEEVI
jgi:predicted amidophosphoribosyltransferase